MISPRSIARSSPWLDSRRRYAGHRVRDRRETGAPRAGPGHHGREAYRPQSAGRGRLRLPQRPDGPPAPGGGEAIAAHRVRNTEVVSLNATFRDTTRFIV